VEASEARLNQAIGAFLPTLKIDGSYGRSYTQPSTVQVTLPPPFGPTTETLSFGTDQPSDSKAITASVSQPIFVGALFPGYQISKKSADLAKEDFKKTVLETSFSVTQAYFGVLKAEELVKLSQQSKEMARSHLDQVRALLAAGVSTQADLLRAEVQLANSEVALTKASNALEIARDAFNNALGRGLEEEVKLTEKGYSASLVELPQYDVLVETAFRNRPDWKQFILNREVGEEYVTVARSEYLPMLKINGKIGNQIVEYSSYKSDVNSWSVTGTASWTLFDGFGIQSRVREAQANFEALKASEEVIKNGILLEVRDAYFNLKSALETIGSAKKAQDSAEESYKVSKLRYRSGVGTNLEEIDAQVALTQARLNYLQTLFDLQIAKSKINKVIGKEVL
jgi:outer membrane protein TolC